jgi:arginase
VIAIVSAPSNLELRPPKAASVPGTSKAPEAQREAGLYRRPVAGGAVEPASDSSSRPERRQRVLVNLTQMVNIEPDCLFLYFN